MCDGELGRQGWGRGRCWHAARGGTTDRGGGQGPAWNPAGCIGGGERFMAVCSAQSLSVGIGGGVADTVCRGVAGREKPGCDFQREEQHAGPRRREVSHWKSAGGWFEFCSGLFEVCIVCSRDQRSVRSAAPSCQACLENSNWHHLSEGDADVRRAEGTGVGVCRP